MSKRRKIDNSDKSDSEENEVSEETKQFRLALYDVVYEILMELAEKRGYNEGVMKNCNEVFNKSSKSTQIDHILFIYPVVHMEYKWNILRNAIQKTSVKKLNELYTKFFGKKKLSKKALVTELLVRFYAIESNLDKREEEDEIVSELQSYLKSEEFRFFSLCGFTLTSEIVDLILEYLPRNFDIILNVGGSAKYLYIKLLASYDHIQVRKDNLYKISSLALKNVKHVTLWKINQSEMEYLWEHISSSRFRKLTILKDYKYFRSVLNSIHKLRKKTKRISKKTKENEKLSYPFTNLTELEIKAYYDPSRQKITSLKNCTFNELFPKLEKIVKLRNSPFELDLFGDECKVREIHTNYLYESMINISNFYENLNQKITNKNFLKVLVCPFGKCNAFQKDGSFSRFVCSFPHLETLKLIFQSNNTVYKGIGIDGTFDFGGILTNLSKSCKIVIVRCRGDPWRRRRSRGYHSGDHLQFDGSVPVTLPTTPLSVESLEIISSDLINHRYIPHDFNLEDILESNFLSVQSSSSKQGSLRSFVADLPLGSRKKRVLYNIMRDDDDDAKLAAEMKQFVTISHLFTDFMEETMFNFDRFDVTIRSRDRWFFDEFIRIRYESRVARKLMVTYSPCYVYAKKHNALLKQQKQQQQQEEEEEEYDESSNFRDMFELSVTQGSEHELLMEKRRPCLLIFKEIMENVVFKVMDNVDIFEISALKNNNKREEKNALQHRINTYLRNKEIVGFELEELNEDKTLLTRSSWM